MQSTPFTRLGPLLLLALLAGCAGTPTPGERPAPTKPMVESGRALEARGEHAAAARAYLDAAAMTDDATVRAGLRLDAARALLTAAESARAESVALETDVPANAPELALRRDLLLAEVALARSQPARALAHLPTTVADSLPLALRLRHLELRARALLDSGDTLASVRERLLLDALLGEGAAGLDNQYALLAALRALGPAMPATTTVEPALAGWIALAHIASGPPRHAVAVESELAVWRSAFPDHPAHPDLIARLIEERRAVPAPSSIAVLLPMRGPVAGSAAAVRDGILAALYADPALGTGADATPVTLRFYDSSDDALAAYGAAVTDGAEVVVGPLRKEAVAQLAAASLPVPVLALNRLGAPSQPNTALRQFALAPEDEASEVADRAWYDGHRRVVILTPTTDFGQRVAGAFRMRWETHGGLVLEERGYDPGENDFTQPITTLLGLSASEARYRALRGLLRQPLEFEPRRRRDVDAVFLAALPTLARQLKPQLAFHHAADVPVYATSHAFAPDASAEANRDLNGLRFCDMPWVLGASDADLAGGLPRATGPGGRLFALGADAFHLLAYLARLQHDPDARLDGQTGLLWLDSSGVVHRRMLCAEIADGQPRLLGYTPSLRPAGAQPMAGR